MLEDLALALIAQANAGFKFSKLFQITIGYRYIAIDYDDCEGKDSFLTT